MKKLFFIPALLVGSLSIAKSYDYEISGVGGWNSTEDTMILKSSPIFSGEFQLNKYTTYIHPEISMLYTSADTPKHAQKKSATVFRIALNGVYEYKKYKQSFIPFVKLGLGYKMTNIEDNGKDNALFTNLLFGAKIPLTDSLAIKTEYAYMVDIQENRKDQNHALFVGVSYAFGATTKKEQVEKVIEKTIDKTAEIFDEPSVVKTDKKAVVEEKVPAKQETFVQLQEPEAVQIQDIGVAKISEPLVNDDDKDGVENYLDKCTRTPAGEEVDRFGCKLDVDYDMDGIKDSIDKCIYTPEGAEVYSNGCMVDGDSDEDGIKDSIDKCMFTPLNAKVYTNGCRVDEDSDGDGIKDSIDECANTPINTPVKTNGCALNSKKEKIIVQQQEEKILEKTIEKPSEESMYKKITGLDIAFKYKSFDVTRKSAKNIQTLINFLNENPDYDIKISGYTDNVGSARYNKRLSQKRANRVKELVSEGGIAEERLDAIGMGEDNPIADNATSKGRAKNRRIEIVLIKN